jgi:hypothetical protein
MRRWLIVAALAVGAAGLQDSSGQKAAGKDAAWRTDYAAARAEARRAGKPLFVVFRCQP